MILLCLRYAILPRRLKLMSTFANNKKARGLYESPIQLPLSYGKPVLSHLGSSVGAWGAVVKAVAAVVGGGGGGGGGGGVRGGRFEVSKVLSVHFYRKIFISSPVPAEPYRAEWYWFKYCCCCCCCCCC